METEGGRGGRVRRQRQLDFNAQGSRNDEAHRVDRRNDFGSHR